MITKTITIFSYSLVSCLRSLPCLPGSLHRCGDRCQNETDVTLLRTQKNQYLQPSSPTSPASLEGLVFIASSTASVLCRFGCPAGTAPPPTGSHATGSRKDRSGGGASQSVYLQSVFSGLLIYFRCDSGGGWLPHVPQQPNKPQRQRKIVAIETEPKSPYHHFHCSC